MSFVIKIICIILIINYFYKKILRFFTLQNYQLLVNMLFTNGYISVTCRYVFVTILHNIL